MIVVAVVAYLMIAATVGGLAWVATRQVDKTVARAVLWAAWMGVWWPVTLGLLFLEWRRRRGRA